MAVERENAVINNQIILRNYFRFSQTGDYFDPYQISKVEILDSDGSTVIETITGANIIKDSTGKYHIVASAITTAKTIYDKWYFTPAQGATEITKTNTCVVWETAAGAGGLTTLNAVREFLKIPDSITTDDTLLLHLITRVSKEIEKFCERTFAQANSTEYYDGDGTDTLLIDNYPINSITSLYDDTDRTYGSDTLIDSDDYVFYSEEGKIVLDGGTFSIGLKNIKIVYNAGYSTIPEDLEQACIKKVAAEYLESQKGIVATKGESNDISKWREEADKVIERYKRIR